MLFAHKTKQRIVFPQQKKLNSLSLNAHAVKCITVKENGSLGSGAGRLRKDRIKHPNSPSLFLSCPFVILLSYPARSEAFSSTHPSPKCPPQISYAWVNTKGNWANARCVFARHLLWGIAVWLNRQLSVGQPIHTCLPSWTAALSSHCTQPIPNNSQLLTVFLDAAFIFAPARSVFAVDFGLSPLWAQAGTVNGNTCCLLIKFHQAVCVKNRPV